MLPASFSRRNGKLSPAVGPPPVQPTINVGLSPAFSNCRIASSPMIVWCSKRG